MYRNLLIPLLLFIACSIQAIAQTDYYYSGGKKYPLNLNNNIVCVSIPKDCDKTSERICATVQVLVTIKDDAFDAIVITRSDFEKLTLQDSWKEDAKSVILTSAYFTEDNVEVVASPYMNVRLKNEDDTDLLASYIDNYKLRLAGKSAFMPWYILALTPESEKSTLQCANELYESGDFAESLPDFVSINYDETIVTSIYTLTTKASSEIFDLQGRRLAEKPQKGVYIQDGRKYVK